ncbi:MAG TPA: discoidin domain-containing protein [Candidatus Cybelea sp.]|nr:discoidin domain-containing protein [Candidatus Cybelea sp.]
MKKFCKQCHKPVPENAPKGLCPECLARAAVVSEPAAGGHEREIEPEEEAPAAAATPPTSKRFGLVFLIVLAILAIIVGVVVLDRHRRMPTNAAQAAKTDTPPLEMAQAQIGAEETSGPQDLPVTTNHTQGVKPANAPPHHAARDKPTRMNGHSQRVVLEFVKTDSQEMSGESGYGANAVDDDPGTIWHTEWLNKSPALPHEIVIELLPPSTIEGFTYLPRQDDSDHGTIKDYEFYVSNDGKDFGRPVKKGTFEPGKEKKTETFEPIKCRFIKLRAISEINGLPLTSAAEIGIVQSSENPSVNNGR